MDAENTPLDQLCTAIEDGDLAGAEALLDAVDNVNRAGFHGRSPVVSAIREGHLTALKLLKKKGIDFSFKDDAGNSLLHLAVKGGHADVSAFLIEHRTEADAVNDNGITPLVLAVLQEDRELCRLLTEAGADALKPLAGGSPLELACRGTNFSVLTLLIKSLPADNADLRKKLPFLCGLAASEGSLDLLKFLRNHFAVDFDFVVTPPEDFKYFINRLCRNGENQEYLARFLQVASPNSYEIPLLAWAAAFAQEAVVEYLLKLGLTVDQPIPPDGATSLMWAAIAGHEEIVQLLLDAGAKASLKDHRGKTALDFVETYGYFFSHRLILKNLRRQRS